MKMNLLPKKLQLPKKLRADRAFGRMTAAGLSLLLLTGGMWVSQTVLQPPIAQAYKSRVDVKLDRLKDETYKSLIRRAEIVARAAAQRSFDRDILMSEVSIMVIAEYQGAEAPLFLLEVSRDNWRQRPDTRRWATYYRSARRLLKLPTAGDPVRPNGGGAQPIDQPIPNVEPVNVPITPPQTETPQPIAGPQALPTPAVGTPPKPGVPAKPGVPVPVPPAAPTPTASPQVTPTPSASPTPQAVPLTAPKGTPKVAVPKVAPKKAAPKPGSAAAKAAEAAAKAAEAAAKAGDAMKKK
jgi:hypothetical protein